MAESGGILSVLTDDGQVAFEIPHLRGVSATAVNDVNGDLWACAKGQLYRYSRNGDLLLQMNTLPSIQGGEPAELVVDGLSGNLWLAVGRDLYRYDFTGALPQTIERSGKISALNLDRERSLLWVARRDELATYDADGQIVTVIKPGRQDHVEDIAFDRFHDQLWVNFSDRLRRYDAQGQPVFEIRGDFRGILQPDGAGGLWLAQRRGLVHLDEFGTVDLDLKPFPRRAGHDDDAGRDQNKALWAINRDASSIRLTR